MTNSKDLKTENTDKEIQKDLNRSENEGYAVMYKSEKDKVVEEIKEENSMAQVKNPSQVKTISKDELIEKIEGNELIQLVNVLKPEYYNFGFIKGSMKIPVDELDQRLGELDKNREVITYCAHYECSASRRAAEKLSAAGFNARAYEGGIKEWKEAGLPIE
ncbi:MAG: rhodanese-like domain-containing protein [Candidatus Omnitrophica bacterium]|nr:rhodanese-like domain-containing protein [Candidatus Omnitrophota bacterium]